MMVSVILLTYNHERYIAQALDSVLSQEAPFEFEVLLTEDCSTDRTREIVTRYASSHPHRIRLFLSERNLNTNEVTLRALRAARGDYVAFLDGDDYWTSPHKLERQVQFLDLNPGYAMCFHNVLQFWEDGSRQPQPFNPVGQALTTGVKDLLPGNFIAGCSPMIRQSALSLVPPWYKGCPQGDTPLYMFAAQHGSIGYLPETMGVYRIHGGGLWSGASMARRWQAVIELSEHLRLHFGAEYERDFVRLLVYQHFELGLTHLQHGGYRPAARALGQSARKVISLGRIVLHERPLLQAVWREVWGRPGKRLPSLRSLARLVLAIRLTRRSNAAFCL